MKTEYLSTAGNTHKEINMLYWNPKYNSITKEPIDSDSKAMNDEEVKDIFQTASKLNARVVNGKDNLPTIEQ